MEQIARSVGPLAMSHRLCVSCFRDQGRLRARSIGLQNSDRIQRRFKGYIAPPGGQAHSTDGFYQELLSKPTIKEPPPPPEAQPHESIPYGKTKTETWEKAQQVFGSREKDALERKKQWDAARHNVAGVMVPPKPTEPDNCCMSGCVNCVWDMYRDEMEEWAAKSAEARTRMQAQNEDTQGIGASLAAKGAGSIANSMDDDGGGSETNWMPAQGNADLFEDIPVGIKEFMKTEKKLKTQHRVEQASSPA